MRLASLAATRRAGSLAVGGTARAPWVTTCAVAHSMRLQKDDIFAVQNLCRTSARRKRAVGAAAARINVQALT
jgi:hypothetical protein